jgi:hypothetical protein
MFSQWEDLLKAVQDYLRYFPLTSISIMTETLNVKNWPVLEPELVAEFLLSVFPKLYSASGASGPEVDGGGSRDT